MNYYRYTPIIITLLLALSACKRTIKDSTADAYGKVYTIAAMRDVMWKGELQGKVLLDTLTPRSGLYGIGPLSGLQGEILVLDGKAYVSRVADDDRMSVAVESDVRAPFFVYANQKQWSKVQIPQDVKTLNNLEAFIKTNNPTDHAFVFKINGRMKSAQIHIQNLPDDAIVRNPEEAHRGQRSYEYNDKEFTAVGFYSESHHGVFTHHDSNMHIHLITSDFNAMGHLDGIEIEQATLWLPI